MPIFQLLKKIKPKKNKIFSLRALLVLTIVLIGGSALYWFGERPTRIRQFCYKTTYGKAYDMIRENLEGNKEWKPGKNWISNPLKEGNADWGWWYPNYADQEVFKMINALYSDCLLESGVGTGIPAPSDLRFVPVLKKFDEFRD